MLRIPALPLTSTHLAQFYESSFYANYEEAAKALGVSRLYFTQEISREIELNDKIGMNLLSLIQSKFEIVPNTLPRQVIYHFLKQQQFIPSMPYEQFEFAKHISALGWVQFKSLEKVCTMQDELSTEQLKLLQMLSRLNKTQFTYLYAKENKRQASFYKLLSINKSSEWIEKDKRWRLWLLLAFYLKLLNPKKVLERLEQYLLI